MSRKRGRIILVGVVGLNISRADFYEKELTFQVSCSYGPGRYDDNYEQKGIDYPLPFVRWTEKRNFEAVLRALEKGQLQVEPLITDRVPLDAYDQVYGNMSKKGAIASVLVYPEKSKENSFVILGNIQPSLQLSVINQLKGNNFIVCDTMNLWIDIALDDLKKVLKH